MSLKISFIAFLALFLASSQAQNWTTVMGLDSGSSIYAMASNNADILYIGGSFYYPFSNLAKVNTTSGVFSDVVINGSDSSIYDLLFNGSKLYIACSQYAGPNRYFSIADLTNNSWFSVGAGGPNNTVRALALFGSEIVLSGAYINSATRIIVQKYSPATNSFSVMGSTFDNTILAQIIVNSVLYVAGSFNDPCSKIAKWNGSDWDCLSSQTIDDPIVTLSSNSDGSAILAGGSFFSPTRSIFQAIGSGNNYTFSPVSNTGNLTGGMVSTIYTTGNNTFIGGHFREKVVRLSNGNFVNVSTSFLSGGMDVFRRMGQYLYAGGNIPYGLTRIALFGTPTPSPTPSTTPSTTSTTTTEAPTSSTDPSSNAFLNIYSLSLILSFMLLFLLI